MKRLPLALLAAAFFSLRASATLPEREGQDPPPRTGPSPRTGPTLGQLQTAASQGAASAGAQTPEGANAGAGSGFDARGAVPPGGPSPALPGQAPPPTTDASGQHGLIVNPTPPSTSYKVVADAGGSGKSGPDWSDKMLDATLKGSVGAMVGLLAGMLLGVGPLAFAGLVLAGAAAGVYWSLGQQSAKKPSGDKPASGS